MSGAGSSVLSRCATANTSRSPFRADSMARSVPGRPAAIGAVNPGNMTVPRRGRTGSVWRVAMVFLGEVNLKNRNPAVAPSIPSWAGDRLSRVALWVTWARPAATSRLHVARWAKRVRLAAISQHRRPFTPWTVATALPARLVLLGATGSVALIVLSGTF